MACLAAVRQHHGIDFFLVNQFEDLLCGIAYRHMFDVKGTSLQGAAAEFIQTVLG